ASARPSSGLGRDRGRGLLRRRRPPGGSCPRGLDRRFGGLELPSESRPGNLTRPQGQPLTGRLEGGPVAHLEAHDHAPVLELRDLNLNQRHGVNQPSLSASCNRTRAPPMIATAAFPNRATPRSSVTIVLICRTSATSPCSPVSGLRYRSPLILSTSRNRPGLALPHIECSNSSRRLVIAA